MQKLARGRWFDVRLEKFPRYCVQKMWLDSRVMFFFIDKLQIDGLVNALINFWMMVS
jgi:hypothetical protein